MAQFTLHTQDTAPAESKELLAGSMKEFGMIPNLHAVMAESPSFLAAYKEIHNLFMKTSFNKEELTVVWQSINVEHACHYCVPAHSMIANSMEIPTEVTTALRNETPLPNPRLEALRTFTLQVIRERGAVDDGKVQKFLDAGFTKQQILEVILGVSQKVMSNYANHLARTPVDAPFKPFEWSKKAS